MGNVEELEKLWETLPKQMFTDIFIRPINVVAVSYTHLTLPTT